MNYPALKGEVSLNKMQNQFKQIPAKKKLLIRNLKYYSIADLSDKLNLGGRIPPMFENMGILRQM